MSMPLVDLMRRSLRAPRLQCTALLCRVACLAACFIATTGTVQTRHGNAIRLSGRVAGWSAKHALYVALWDENGFLKTPVQQTRIEPGAGAEFQFQVTPGRWALSAFEDVNSNGILDMGAFGPKEPSGFLRPFHGWHKPRFDDVASQFDRDTTGVIITLNH